MKKKKVSNIVLIHFLNDFSGSPNVLSIVAKGFVDKGYSVCLMTNRGTGFLSNLKGVKYDYINYSFHKNKIYATLCFILCQFQLFFKVFLGEKDNTIYYINTITPIGAALACWLSGKTTVYHSHENMKEHKPLYTLYRSIYNLCNQKTIFVSKYVESTAINCRNGIVVYNSVAVDFLRTANEYIEAHQRTLQQTVLMVASLKSFKGVYEFVDLSKKYSQYRFELVLNATQDAVEKFSKETSAPSNIKIFSAQKDLHPFYQRAKLLLQMSNPNRWVETFGLTILEAMFYGIPSIVPNAGGPLELVEDGINGFNIAPQNLNQIGERLELLMNDDCLYKSFSNAALAKSKKYDVNKMMDKIEKYIIE